MSAAKGPGRPRIPAWQSLVAQPAGVEDLANAKMIDVALLDPNPYQPRSFNDEDAAARAALGELAADIKAHGILQPLLVRPHPDTARRFQIVAGERRWRAARMGGIERVPCVEQTLDDTAMERLALVENIQRTDLNPLDEAHAYRRLMERFTLSLRDLAASVHKSHEYVAQRLRLIEDPQIEATVRAGQMGPTVAQEVARVKDPTARAGLLDRATQGERVTVQDVQKVKAAPRVRERARPDAPKRTQDGPERASHPEVPTAPVVSNNLTPRSVDTVVDPGDALEKGLKESNILALLTYGVERGWSCQELLRVIRERHGDAHG